MDRSDHVLERRTRKDAPNQARPTILFEALEERQLLSTSPIYAGTKIKGINLSSNNVSINETLITVPFTGNININNQADIQLRGYAYNPLSPTLGQVKVNVRVISASVLSADHSYLQITTDRLMRKGGSIIFYSGALKDDSGNLLAQQTVYTVKGQNKDRFTLACRAFRPANYNRFTNDTFADSPTPLAASTAVPEATVTASLQSFLDEKVSQGIITQAQENSAMAAYNSDSVKGLIPNANLRAALYSLTGTLAESAIASYVSGANLTGKPYTILDFQDPADETVPVAQTSVRQSDGRLRTVFKPQFQGEPFQVLSAWLAHEAIHQDTVVGLQEEEAATTVETLVLAQQALVDPGFLKAGTQLVNTENEKLFAFLNSGEAIFPYVGLLQGPIVNGTTLGVLPYSKTPTDGKGIYTSWQNFVSRSYLSRGSVSQTTPVDPIFKTYYTNITGKAAPSNLAFNDALITDMDSFQGIVPPHQAVILAQDLHLTIS